MKLLLVDDSKPDVTILSRIFKNECDWEVFSVSDGEQALNYLYGLDGFAGAERPDVVILDLNLPKQGGFKVLETMKEDDSLQSIPVVVLSTSNNQKDINRAYDMQVSAYYVKETTLDGVRSFIRNFVNWWSAVTLPEMEKEDEWNT